MPGGDSAIMKHTTTTALHMQADLNYERRK
jgi:hypothetical protein